MPRRRATSPTTNAPDYASRWVIVSGIRDPSPIGERAVQQKIAEVIEQYPLGFIFGGARGVDTIALRAAYEKRAAPRGTRPPAHMPNLVVIVPGTVLTQPPEAAAAIGNFADESIELRLDLARSAAYATRNGRMVTEGRLRDPDERPILLAFPTPGVTGGTRMTMDIAQSWGLTLDVVEIPRTAGGED